MTTKTQTQAIQQAFALALAEMPDLLADAKNPHFRSKYVSLPRLLQAVRPVLAKHGLAVVQELTPPRVNAYSDTGDSLTLVTKIVSSLHSETLTLASWPIPLLQNPQHMGSYLTYARRYSLMTALGVMGDPDDDGQRAAELAGETTATATATLDAAAGQAIWIKAQKNGIFQEKLLQLASDVAGQKISRLRDFPANLQAKLEQVIDAEQTIQMVNGE